MVMFPGQQDACALEQTRLAVCSLECWLVLDIDSIVSKSASVSCTLHASNFLNLLHVKLKWQTYVHLFNR